MTDETNELPTEIPTLRTERLVLRPFELADGPRVQELAGDRRIAANMHRIPHPYPDGAAEEWIATHAANFAEGGSMDLAITLDGPGTLAEAIGLFPLRGEHSRAEVGWWVGVDYWSRGYCTEAAAAVVRYAFDVLGLHRLQGHHMTRNPASGRVMAKIGMQHEGTIRHGVRKWDVFEDVELWGILSTDLTGETS